MVLPSPRCHLLVASTSEVPSFIKYLATDKLLCLAVSRLGELVLLSSYSFICYLLISISHENPLPVGDSSAFLVWEQSAINLCLEAFQGGLRPPAMEP